MSRLARESIFADRASILHRSAFFPPLPIVSRSPAHIAHPSLPQSPATLPYAHPHTQSDGHLMTTDCLPTRLPPATVDRSHHRHGRLPIGLHHHTPYRPCRRAGLPTGCLSIPPHSAWSSCLSPAPVRSLCLVAPGAMRQSPRLERHGRGRRYFQAIIFFE